MCKIREVEERREKRASEESVRRERETPARQEMQIVEDAVHWAFLWSSKHNFGTCESEQRVCEFGGIPVVCDIMQIGLSSDFIRQHVLVNGAPS